MCILLVDGQNQPLNGGLASLLSMVFGGFVLLPYCALRRSPNAGKYKWNFLVRLFDSKAICIFLILATIALVLFALIFDDFGLFFMDFVPIDLFIL
jgi:uncharacterized membrane protein YdcZ (DUF606 family)